MKNKDNLMNLLEAIKFRRPLVMDLGDNVMLHMKWNGESYEDEMGVTTMNVINDILNGKVIIKEKKVEIREDI